MSDEEIYEYLGQAFEWDRMKAARNVFKHGVRFTEAASVFFDPGALFEFDDAHSGDEDRFRVLGVSFTQKAHCDPCHTRGNIPYF